MNRISKISVSHFFKLTYRSILFLTALALYIVLRIRGEEGLFGDVTENSIILPVIWVVFVAEMVLRFFPSKLESMGCQKQFQRNYRPVSADAAKPPRISKSILLITALWILLNGTVGVLYFLHVIDEGILLLIALAYSVCDMICILFFCPFQTWFMKNKCCTTCRIYNWDYAMMFTPLLFVNRIGPGSLFWLAILLLIRWEVTAFRHPERFSEKTNACLSCQHCSEKLCHHKKQLRGFLQKHAEHFHRTKQ